MAYVYNSQDSLKKNEDPAVKSQLFTLFRVDSQLSFSGSS